MSIRAIHHAHLPPTTRESDQARTPHAPSQEGISTIPHSPKPTKGGEAALIDAMTQSLAHLQNIEPSFYRSELFATREALIQGSRTVGQGELKEAMNKAAHFLTEESRLLDMIDVYRNLLQTG